MSLNSIIRLVFTVDMQSVYCKVDTEFLNIV